MKKEIVIRETDNTKELFITLDSRLKLQRCRHFFFFLKDVIKWI